VSVPADDGALEEEGQDLEALERVIAEACLGAHSGQDIAADLRGFLERRGVVTEDVEAILQAPRRLAVYRSLVRNGLSSVVLRMLPRTRARLNAACAGRFDADFAAFVEERAPRTHYLRDVPFELVRWARPRWQGDERVPAYIGDLASHELAQFEVASAGGARESGAVVDIALDRPLAFHESMRILRYGWAVHELSAAEDANDEPPRRDVHLLAYRDAAHAVRWLDLTPLAAAILDVLAAGEPLGAAIERACTQAGLAPPAVLPDVARLLADLGTRGVLLGAPA
jgi:hypothetical protein